MGVLTALNGAVMAVVVVMAVVGGGEGKPATPVDHWRMWGQLQSHLRQEQQERQQQQQQLWARMGHAEPAEQQRRGGVLWVTQQQQYQRELQLEQEQDIQDEMEKIVEDNHLEDVVHQMGIDVMGRILRPLRKQPVLLSMDNCVSRSTPVMFTQLGVGGNFVYTACGSGNGAALHLHFQARYPVVHTTPSLDTTTPAEGETTAEANAQNDLPPRSNKGSDLPPRSNKGSDLPPRSNKGSDLPPRSNKGSDLPPRSNKGSTMEGEEELTTPEPEAEETTTEVADDTTTEMETTAAM